MSDQNINKEDEGVGLVQINLINRTKAEKLLNILKAKERTKKWNAILISKDPRTIKFVQEGKEPRVGNTTTKQGNNFTENKIMNIIIENRKLKEEDIY